MTQYNKDEVEENFKLLIIPFDVIISLGVRSSCA